MIFYAVSAKEPETAKKLLYMFVEMGVPANYTDTLDQTALFYASRDGLDDCVNFLIKNGCNANHVDTYG